MRTMNDYKIYCTEEQTKKALELGAPIEYRYYVEGVTTINNIWFRENDKCFRNPTAEEMIGWLEEKGVNCFILRDMSEDDEYYNIQINEKLITLGHPRYNYPISYDSRKKATIAAISKALEYLENKNKEE